MLVTLQFQEISVAEHLLEPPGNPLSFVYVAIIDKARNLGRGASGQSDEALGIFLQQFPVDAGAVVETVDMGPGNQLHQIAIAGIVPG